jgi:hypothetical protein
MVSGDWGETRNGEGREGDGGERDETSAAKVVVVDCYRSTREIISAKKKQEW